MSACFSRLIPLVLACLSVVGADAVYIGADGTLQKAEPYLLKHAKARTSFQKRNISYTVTYVDVDTASGLGFDDASLGAERRATLESVLAYLTDQLQNDGSFDVLVVASQNEGAFTTALASAGPFFSSAGTGFKTGLAFTHITTGVDPIPGTADIQAVVDFGYNYYSGTGSPASDQFDLFSVLLHEMIHGLGMLSAVQSDGSASLHTTYDSFLRSGAGTQLYDADANFAGTSNMLVGQDQGLLFSGPATEAVLGGGAPVYSPAVFQPGSSLSHWCLGFASSSMQPQNYTGVTQRTLGTFELAMLSDIGYSVNLTHELVFPWISNSNDFSSTVIVNNNSSSQVSFSFTGRRADGTSATSQTYSLNGGGFLQEVAENIFPDLPRGGGLTLTLTSSSPSLAGRWVTFDRAAETPSQGLAIRRSLRPTQRAGTTVNIGYLPGNANFKSAPVLVNMETEAVDISVYFYDTAGNHINTVLIEDLAPLTPKVVAVIGNTDGDQYAVASAHGVITGAVFVFNDPNQTAIGNVTAISGFIPPD